MPIPSCCSFALAGGEAAFGDNCAPCHGRGAQGAFGYPNLRDDSWLWGGTLDAIQQTIQHGIRADDPETRSQIRCRPSAAADPRREPQIDDVAEYVLSLSGTRRRQGGRGRGAKIFADNCSPCHGEDGKGNQALGAPNLTDELWLYGGRQGDHRRDDPQRPRRRDADLGRHASTRRRSRSLPSTSIRWAAASSRGLLTC